MSLPLSANQGLSMFLPAKKSRMRAVTDTLPLCLFNRHAPYRQFVKWDGLNFVGQCKHCGEAIRRKEHRVWLKEWREDAIVAKPVGIGTGQPA